jgi:DnaJ-class molecular chaperone
MRVPTLEGFASLKIPAGAQPWQKFLLSGHGLPAADGARGDLYITLRFVFPKQVGSREAALWRQLKAAHAAQPTATGKL